MDQKQAEKAAELVETIRKNQSKLDAISRDARKLCGDCMVTLEVNVGGVGVVYDSYKILDQESTREIMLIFNRKISAICLEEIEKARTELARL